MRPMAIPMATFAQVGKPPLLGVGADGAPAAGRGGGAAIVGAGGRAPHGSSLPAKKGAGAETEVPQAGQAVAEDGSGVSQALHEDMRRVSAGDGHGLKGVERIQDSLDAIRCMLL